MHGSRHHVRSLASPAMAQKTVGKCRFFGQMAEQQGCVWEHVSPVPIVGHFGNPIAFSPGPGQPFVPRPRLAIAVWFCISGAVALGYLQPAVQVPLA